MTNRDSKKEHYAHGLEFDLAVMNARVQSRRRALNWLLAGGTTALVAACGGGGSDSSSSGSSSTGRF